MARQVTGRVGPRAQDPDRRAIGSSSSTPSGSSALRGRAIDGSGASPHGRSARAVPARFIRSLGARDDREGIDPARVEAAVFDLGGVFLAGGVESVQASAIATASRPTRGRRSAASSSTTTRLWSAVERGQATVRATSSPACARSSPSTAATSRAEDAGTSWATPARERPSACAPRSSRPPRASTHACRPRSSPTTSPSGATAGARSSTSTRSSTSSSTRARSACGSPSRRSTSSPARKLGLPHDALFFLDDLGVNLKAARAPRLADAALRRHGARAERARRARGREAPARAPAVHAVVRSVFAKSSPTRQE